MQLFAKVTEIGCKGLLWACEGDMGDDYFRVAIFPTPQHPNGLGNGVSPVSHASAHYKATTCVNWGLQMLSKWHAPQLGLCYDKGVKNWEDISSDWFELLSRC